LNSTKNIRYCFNQAADSYDGQSYIQKQIGLCLIQSLLSHLTNATHIIDLGCGSGFTTLQLAKAIEYQSFAAIDIADQLLTKAENRLNPYGVDVYAADFDNLSTSKQFNLIFSNMALHWGLQFAKTLHSLTTQLAANGVIAFSIPLTYTFQELPSRSRNVFYDLKKIKTMLEKLNLSLLNSDEDYLVATFNSMLAALRSIKASGANYLMSHTSSRLNKTQLTKLQTFDLTYHVGYFVAKKND